MSFQFIRGLYLVLERFAYKLTQGFPANLSTRKVERMLGKMHHLDAYCRAIMDIASTIQTGIGDLSLTHTFGIVDSKMDQDMAPLSRCHAWLLC